MTLRHATVPCAGFASVVAVLRYAAQQRRSIPADSRASIGVVTTPSYGETAYYNAVSNRWFGLGDYATDQPGRIMAIWRERSVELRFSTPSSIASALTHSDATGSLASLARMEAADAVQMKGLGCALRSLR
jgi:hypothetical protein